MSDKTKLSRSKVNIQQNTW